MGFVSADRVDKALKTKPAQKLIEKIQNLGAVEFDSVEIKEETYDRGILYLYGYEKNTFKVIFRVGFAELPGCCGVCVSTGTYVHDRYNGKGIGKVLMALKKYIARHMGYTVLLLTEIERSSRNRKIINKTGFTDFFDFLNNRSGNVVVLSAIPLRCNASLERRP